MAVLPALLAKSSICYNPIIYAGLNNQFSRFLKKIFDARSSRTAVPDSQHTALTAMNRQEQRKWGPLSIERAKLQAERSTNREIVGYKRCSNGTYIDISKDNLISIINSPLSFLLNLNLASSASDLFSFFTRTREENSLHFFTFFFPSNLHVSKIKRDFFLFFFFKRRRKEGWKIWVKGKRSFHASEKLRYAVLIDDLVFLFFVHGCVG